MKRLLIFGVAGFVGPYLIKEFQQGGYEIFGSDIVAEHANGFWYKAAELTDANAVSEIVQEVNPDVIVNLAAVSSVGLSWQIPQQTMAVNVIGVLNILEAARNCPTYPSVLLVGSSEEYAASSCPIKETHPLKADNPYGISKMAAEQLAELYRERYGMKVYYVRSFNHTGIGQSEKFIIPSWCKQVADTSRQGHPGVIKVGNTHVYRDFSNVKDVVRAYRMVIESDDCSTVYNIGSGKAVLLKELLDYIISFSEIPLTVEIDPVLVRPVDNLYSCCDYQLIAQKVGWVPEYSWQDTIDEMMAYYQGSKWNG